MARGSLSGRLGRIRERQKNEARDNAAPPPVAPTEGELAGWEKTGDFLFERESLAAVPEYRMAFSRYLPLLFPREREILESAQPPVPALSNLVFFDLETTGLSRGAGTLAFMAGIATLDGANTVRIRQLLLADYPGEAEFLTKFSECVNGDSVLVSFNGKAFDSQILYNRFAMNGVRSPFIARPPLHLDLLYPSRRVWKDSVESCRLSTLEEFVLGIRRVDDLPGSEAPDAWFSFVRRGETDRLLGVGDHNRDDCATLPRLLFALDRAIELGEHRAGLVRAIALRSAGDYAGARAFLEPLAARGDRIALRLLAIDAEHRIGDLGLALECAKTLGDAARVERVERKVLLSAMDRFEGL